MDLLLRSSTKGYVVVILVHGVTRYIQQGDSSEVKVVTPLLLFLWLFKTAPYEKLFSSPLFKLVEHALNLQHYSAPPAEVDQLQQSILRQQQQIDKLSAELVKYKDHINAIPSNFPRVFSSIGELSRHPTTSEPLKRKATHATDRLRYEMELFDHVLSAHHDTLTEALCYQHKFKVDCTPATSEASQLVSAILQDVPSGAASSTIPAIDDFVVSKIEEKFEQLRRPHWMVCIFTIVLHSMLICCCSNYFASWKAACQTEVIKKDF